jgi:hypothetical protein
MRAGHITPNLCFLHPVGSMGNVVQSGVPGCETSTHYFLCSGGTCTDSMKKQWDTLCQTFDFASNGICGSRSAFQCVRGAKCHHTIFHAWDEPVWIPQKVRLNTIRRLFLHLVGSAVHVVHSGASGAQNVDALFCCAWV